MQLTTSSRSNTERPSRPAARLAACLLVLGVGWLGVLPIVGRTGSVRAMISRNESLGIDPSAKFYSELPLMVETWNRVRRTQDGGSPSPADKSFTKRPEN